MRVFDYSYLAMIKLDSLWKNIYFLSNNLIWLAYWWFWFWSCLIFVYLFTVFCDLDALIWIIIFFFIVIIFTMKKLATASTLICIFRSRRTSQFNFISWVLLHCGTSISNTRIYRWYFWRILRGFRC